eukprot:20859-Rhodomonas_salina.1
MALRRAWVRLRGALSHLLSTTASFFTGKERARSGVEKGRREREGERRKGARADESREQGNVETWDVITEVQSRHNRVLCMLLQQKGTLGSNSPACGPTWCLVLMLWYAATGRRIPVLGRHLPRSLSVLEPYGYGPTPLGSFAVPTATGHSYRTTRGGCLLYTSDAADDM